MAFHGPDASNKTPVELTGQDGNAFSIIGRCATAARKARWSKEQIEALRKDMMSGDYDHVLTVACENFEVE